MSGINLDRLSKLTAPFRQDGTDHFDWDGNSLELETGLFLYGLVRRARPKVIVETGTWKGYSSAFMACALADNFEGYPTCFNHMPPGIIYTVDKDDHEPKKLWDYLGITPYIEFKKCKSVDFYPTRMPIDILFLDAEHYEKDIIEEFVHFANELAPKYTIIIHDTRLESFTLAACNKIFDICSTHHPVSRMRFENMRGLDIITRTT